MLSSERPVQTWFPFICIHFKFEDERRWGHGTRNGVILAAGSTASRARLPCIYVLIALKLSTYK